MGFNSTDDLISGLSSGQKNRATINKITNVLGVAGRVNYELELSNAKSAAFNEEQQDVPPESELVRMRV